MGPTATPTQPLPDRLAAERDRLAGRLRELEAGRAELQAILEEAERREDRALAEVRELAVRSGGVEVVAGPGLRPGLRDSRPVVGYQFREPGARPPDLESLWARYQTVRSEAEPVYAAVGAVDDAIDACRAALDRAEAELARSSAAQEADRAERQQRWVTATRERSLPSWRDNASAILARLDLNG